jgi:ATP-binding cassette, subfamily B (MDR/TAP), member 1
VQGYCFGFVGANLGTRVRELFLKAVLRQEIGWFDLDANSSGALTARLSQDAPAVRGAVADVMGIVVQNMSTLIAGYVVAFTNGWKMTLVVTAALPLLAFSSYMQVKFFTGATFLFSHLCCVQSQN